MIKVYVAGPYSTGNQARNVLAAIRLADLIAKDGYIPFVPHLTHFWDMMFPREYWWWLKYDFEWLKCCDALVRIPGESPGAEKEIAFAKENHIPIYVMDNEFDHGEDLFEFLHQVKVNKMAKQ